MQGQIRRLYPAPDQEIELVGLYLGHDLRSARTWGDKPFIYANFISSLDGRIAVAQPSGHGLVIPKQTANDRDWRLFQELAVQADVVISSGRYLRDYADGRAQEILRVYDDPNLQDLKDWRTDRGLSPYPDIAVISNSLDFPLPEALFQHGRKITVVTSESADRERLGAVREKTERVLIAGRERVDGARMIQGFEDWGYRTVYSSAGPKILHMLLAANRLDRLYLTTAQRLLGGRTFATIVDGGALKPARETALRELYLDPHALGGAGQLFMVYDLAKSLVA
jgi:riboflavin biosynthesis pyrimidine reductase